MKVLSLDIGINNLSYCILSYDKENYDIQGWDILNVNPYEDDNKEIATINKQIDKDNKKRVKDEGEGVKLKKKKLKKKPTLNELSNKIISTFDAKSEFLDCDYVIIENQPCMKNPTMKSIQMIVYSYFYIRGMIDNKSEIIKDIVFISAGNKLKVYDGPPIEITVKSRYTRNKKLGIAHTRYLLKNHEEYLSFFELHKKKDDLADAFLQAAYFIHKRLKL
jgi:hypothetical protein